MWEITRRTMEIDKIIKAEKAAKGDTLKCVGKKIGKLTIIKTWNKGYVCRCVCGKEVLRSVASVGRMLGREVVVTGNRPKHWKGSSCGRGDCRDCTLRGDRDNALTIKRKK